MKREAVKLPDGNWSIRNENGEEIYLIVKYYRTRRSKHHDGYNKLIPQPSGEYVQYPYFSHFSTLKQAFRCCGC